MATFQWTIGVSTIFSPTLLRALLARKLFPMFYLFLTITLLGIIYAGSVAVMVSGLASAKPETPKDAAFAAQLRRKGAASKRTESSAFHAA